MMLICDDYNVAIFLRHITGLVYLLYLCLPYGLRNSKNGVESLPNSRQE